MKIFDFMDKEVCKYGFDSCGNIQYKLCETCEEGSNYEHFEDFYNFEKEEEKQSD
jgi:hypothetical protein